MAQVKTNAMRILDTKRIPYAILTYDNKDGKVDGISVAAKINKDPREVYKTLVTQGTSRSLFVFVIPVEAELDLKKAAKAAGEKKIDMIPVKDIQKWTGYIRGGCSPIGMKKEYSTFFDISCESLNVMVVSGGRIGIQIVINPIHLMEMTKGQLEDITKSF